MSTDEHQPGVDQPPPKVVLTGPAAAIVCIAYEFIALAICAVIFAACIAAVGFPLYVAGYLFDAALWSLTGRSAPSAVDVAGGLVVPAVVFALWLWWRLRS